MPLGRKRDNDAADDGVIASYAVNWAAQKAVAGNVSICYARRCGIVARLRSRADRRLSLAGLREALLEEGFCVVDMSLTCGSARMAAVSVLWCRVPGRVAGRGGGL